MAEKLHIVLFGGNTKQQDGPLLTTAKILKKRGCKVTIVTDTVHLKLPTKDGKTLEKKHCKNKKNIKKTWKTQEKNMTKAWNTWKTHEKNRQKSWQKQGNSKNNRKMH